MIAHCNDYSTPIWNTLMTPKKGSKQWINGDQEASIVVYCSWHLKEGQRRTLCSLTYMQIHKPDVVECSSSIEGHQVAVQLKHRLLQIYGVESTSIRCNQFSSTIRYNWKPLNILNHIKFVNNRALEPEKRLCQYPSIKSWIPICWHWYIC